jgi:hypothetical protein
MLLSKLIEILQEIYDENGELPVYSENPDHGTATEIAVYSQLTLDKKVVGVSIEPKYPDEDEELRIGDFVEFGFDHGNGMNTTIAGKITSFHDRWAIVTDALGTIWDVEKGDLIKIDYLGDEDFEENEDGLQ